MSNERSGSRDVRSHPVWEIQSDLPSETDPCKAPDGHYWVYAFASAITAPVDTLLIGKWLIRMECPYVEEYWGGMIRPAVEAGTLGPSAKIATEWGRNNDPAGPWRSHVVCVYTADWRDQADVLRVAKRLHEIGAVKKMRLDYKPDIFTYGGLYEGSSPGDVAMYKCKAPYDKLVVDEKNRASAERMLASA